MINWKVRFKNKAFWLALIPAIFVFVSAVMQIFGFDFDFTQLSTQIVGAVEALFMVFAILGIVVDPTVEGVSDSYFSLTKEFPTPNSREE